MPVFKTVDKNFFKKWSPDMAYTLGFFAADGCLTVNKRGAHFWSIQITDRKLLDAIKKAIKAAHKINKRERNGNEQTIYRLQIGSREMCADLRRLGMSERKSRNLKLPNVPERYFADFLRGYFDGDGNVWSGFIHISRRRPSPALAVMFTSCSEEFLRDLLKRLRGKGLRGGSLYKAKRNYARLQFSVQDSLKLYDLMYNACTPAAGALFLERKRKVFEKYKKLRE